MMMTLVARLLLLLIDIVAKWPITTTRCHHWMMMIHRMIICLEILLHLLLNPAVVLLGCRRLIKHLLLLLLHVSLVVVVGVVLQISSICVCIWICTDLNLLLLLRVVSVVDHCVWWWHLVDWQVVWCLTITLLLLIALTHKVVHLQGIVIVR